MINFPLFKRDTAENFRLWILVTGVMAFLLVLVIGNYDPAADGVSGLFSMLPLKVRRALGVELYDNTLTGTAGQYLYGSFLVILPAVYGIAAANRLVVSKVEDGMMTHLLCSPLSRSAVVYTQACFLGLSQLAMYLLLFVLGSLFAAFWCPGELGTWEFLLINLGGFCLQFVLSSIAFLISCISNKAGGSRALGFGVALVFYVLWMLSAADGFFSFGRFLTPFTLYSVSGILEGSAGFLLADPLLVVSGIALDGVGVYSFSLRDLPL